MAHTAPVDPQKQLHDFFGITAVLESTGHAQRFESLEARMELVESGIRRVESRLMPAWL